MSARRLESTPFQRLLLLAACSLTLLVAGAANAACPDNNLLAYWAFDGNGNDSSACANDGLVNGAVSALDYFGNSTGAYSFDGVNDSVAMNSTPSLRPVLPITFTFRMRHDCAGKRCEIFWNDASADYVGIRILLTSSGRLNAMYGDGGVPSSLNRRSAESSVYLPPGVWHDVAVVIINPTFFKFYIDGVRESPGSISYSGLGGSIAYDGFIALIGLDGLGAHPFDGELDDVRFYDRVLSDAEIAALHPDVCVGSDGLRGHWPMEGDATDATDCMNDGAVNGATLTTDHAATPASAYHFDGVDDSIDLGRSFHLKPELPVTLSMMINPDCDGINCWLFANDADPGNYSGVSLLLSNTTLVARHGSGNGISSASRRDAIVVAPSLTSGSWHHLGIVINGPTDSEFYVDGARLDTAGVSYDGNGGGLVYHSKPALAGTEAFFNRPYRGDMDDLRLYDRALSHGEIAKLDLQYCAKDDGLLGHWAMDGDATDSSACGHDGTVSGAVLTADHESNPDSAYAFDGLDDVIDLGTTTVLKPDLPVTFAAMVRHDCTVTGCRLLDTDDDPSVFSGIGFDITSSGHLKARYGDGGLPSPDSSREVVASTALTPGVWYHVAVVVRDADNFEFYIDGLRENPANVSYSGTGGPLAYQPGLVRAAMGAPTFTGGPGFDGDLDDVRFYDRALTPGEIVALAPGYCVGPDGLLGHWPIEGDATDATACMNDGVVIGPGLAPDLSGSVDGAYDFDGVDDIIALGSASHLKPALPVTIALMVRNDCTPGAFCEFFSNDPTPGFYSGVRFYMVDTGALGARFGAGLPTGSTNRRSARATTPLSPGAWQHVAVVIRGAEDFEFYLDGVPDPVSSYSGTGGPLGYVVSNALIGGTSDGGAIVPYEGALDDVRFYDRALTQSEIAELAWSARVVGYQKISDTSGYLSSPGSPGSNPGGFLVDNDSFGAAAGLGDLDGDSIPDLAVGASLRASAALDRGAVFVLLLNADGTVKSRVEIGHGTGGLVLAEGDVFGRQVTALGDVDGDGVTDLAVSANGDDTAGNAAGAVYVLFLNSNGTLKSFQKITDGVGGGPSLDATDQFSYGLGGIGDVNGDGVPDLGVSARGDDDAGPDMGAVYLLFLKGGLGEPNPGQVLGTPVKITAGQGGFVGPQGGPWFGYSIAALGDLDDDSQLEIAVGDSLSNEGGAGSGSVWILSLQANGTVLAEHHLSATSVSALGAELEAGDRFGIASAALGDIDGDGTEDLAVNALFDDDGGVNRGAIYLLYLNADKTVKRLEKISDTRGGFDGALDDGDVFGWGLSLVGDVSGDGTYELAAGAKGDGDGGANRGAVYILSLDYSTTCGDFIVEPSEACDDGNTLAEDGCSNLCVAEFCGDGVHQAGLGETCDDGNLVSEDGCSALCIAEFCGDGIVQPGLAETCDDGNMASLDGCSDVCEPESVVNVLGTAAGGSLDYTIAGQTLSVSTSNGQTASQVASAMAAAINGNATLAGMGIVAQSVGDTLFHGDAPSAFDGSDAGVALSTTEAAWLSALSVIPRTLDFEVLLPADPVPDASDLEGITFNYLLDGAVALATDAFETASPINSLGLSGGDDAFLDGDTLDLVFPRPLLAAGFFVVTSDPAAAGEILLSTPYGTTGNSALPHATTPDGGHVYFLGHVATEPFTQATLDFVDDGGIHFVYTVDDITAAVPHEDGCGFAGIAVGGHVVGATVDGVSVQISTTPGQTAAEVAQALADAINANGQLKSLGTAAAAVGDQLLTNGTIGLQVNGDPGLGGTPTSLPALAPVATGLLAIVIAGAGLLAERRRRRG